MLFAFWEKVIKPIMIYTKAKKIVEIGAFDGVNTKNLVDYCRSHLGTLTVIDPNPRFSVQEWTALYSPHLEVREQLSLQVLPELVDYDAILIDGDHNWYTVYNELKMIESMAFEKGYFPLVFFHDTEWPYARRDMYYLPETIPQEYRQPYAKKGIQQGQSDLIDGGFNAQLCNALHEGGPRNGVLTAIEDFLKETTLPYYFYSLHSNYGLGIIIPSNPDLNVIVQRYVRNSDL